jgi:hypothetical protein
MFIEVRVTEDGKVTQFTTEKMVTTKKSLKSLSPNTVQDIKDNISALKVSAQLIDLDEGKPRCTDAPSSKVLIMKNNVEKVIAGKSSCHRLAVKSKAATNLVDIMTKIQEQK